MPALHSGQVVDGFRTDALYVDGAGHPRGARFHHQRTGFTFDYIQMESVPQAFVWVNTWPDSDRGEPHTQEHLLLGKGNEGRSLANAEAMSLTEAGAFTMQWRTCYHFNTRAGHQAFYDVLEKHVHALLYPNYSDEEVRREVRNFGVAENPQSHRLGLQEQGTVYQEMVSTYRQADVWGWRAFFQAAYGAAHPMSFESGGTPQGLRHLTAQEIHRFHDQHYVLNNMGMVGAFPRSMPLHEVLRKTGAILNRLQPGPAPVFAYRLPPPQPAPAGAVRIVDYPDRNEQQPESVMVAWPAVRRLTTKDELLLDLFMDNVSADSSSNLYKVFVDSKTRRVDTGAKSVGDYVSSDQGFPLMVELNGIPSARITPALTATIRQNVQAELGRIASWPDGSPQLVAFNRRLLSRVTERRRDLSKFITTPPEFGFRSTGSDWMDHLLKLDRSGQFGRSLTMGPELDYVAAMASSRHNVWRDMLRRWHLSDTTPYVIAPHASPAALARETEAKKQRIEARVAALEKQYDTTDEQAALKQYKTQYDAVSVRLEKAAQSVPYPPFTSHPPMSQDDDLVYRMETLKPGVPLVTSTFQDLNGTTTGLAFNLRTLSNDELRLISVLPDLLTQVGVGDMSFDTMQDRLRNEILGLNANVSVNERTGRVELVVKASGNNAAESARALDWLKLVLWSPNWRADNLPRLRDLVDRRLSELRDTREGAEETWVNAVGLSWRHQTDPWMLSAASFLTQVHNAQRLRWRLMAVPQVDVAQQFLKGLSQVGSAPRADLQQLLAALRDEKTAPPASLSGCVAAAKQCPDVARRAAEDLQATLPDIPDATLASDWATVCSEMAEDVGIGPQRTLQALDSIRSQLLHAGNARVFIVGPPDQTQALRPKVEALVGRLADGGGAIPATPQPPLVTSHLREREPEAKPVFVGLVNPNSQGGVFLYSAPSGAYQDTDEASLVRVLAGNLYAGHGSHTLYMKTWAAGLAYSNGIRPSLEQGRLNYYAERCPELPQTMGFVVRQVKEGTPGPTLASYALAQAFPTRAAQTFDTRGEAMARDLADGVTPDVVRHFHQALLAFHDTSGWAEKVTQAIIPVDGTVLPGLDKPCAQVRGGAYVVIGAEHQFDLMQQYLTAVEGPAVRLYRLYPRDFWLP